MEYLNIYNILYETLDLILPKVIIRNIIFEYTIKSNKYIYKFTIPYHKRLLKCYLNKQLGILCCESSASFTLVDMNTGDIHNNSIIDVNTLHSYERMDYFDNDVIIMTNSVVSKYILDNKQYKLLCFAKKQSSGSYVCVCNDYVYILSRCEGDFSLINMHNLMDLKCIATIYCSHIKHGQILQMSVCDDMLYIYDGDRRVYVHDVNDNMNLVNTKKLEYSYRNIQLCKNKLYCYTSGTIHIYDILLSTQIHQFVVEHINLKSEYKLIVSDGILTLSNEKHIICYVIK
jgi:hypothetical protein